jgi:hypothetical protein
MDTLECITTKLDVREFSAEDVPVEVRSNVLEAARQARALALILNTGDLS